LDRQAQELNEGAGDDERHAVLLASDGRRRAGGLRSASATRLVDQLRELPTITEFDSARDKLKLKRLLSALI
jgi:hypothetical protein